MSRPYSEFQNENSPDITIQNKDKKQNSLRPDDLKPNTPHVLLFMSVMTSCCCWKARSATVWPFLAFSRPSI